MTYQYDSLYRLTRESILGASPLGAISYGFDPVGNRLAMTSTVFGIPSQVNTFDANDRLGSDTYDAAGNTKAATIHDSINGTDIAFTYSYDFDNRILCVTSVSSVVQLTYDGDGNRVQKTVTDAFGTRTTRYLVDQNNLTGYSQVLEELDASNNVTVAFTVGLDVISQTRFTPTNEVTHYFGYDGHGNTRFLTDTNGVITDRWDYDAYGNIIARSGSTFNNLLYCGEYRDPDLGLYFLRARYMEPGRGRFWTMDAWEGSQYSPSSLHKYLYCGADPVGRIDPSGQLSYTEVLIVTDIILILHVVWHALYPPPVTGLKWHGTMFGAGGAFGVGGGRFDFVLTSEPYRTGRVLNAWQRMQVKVVTWFFMAWVSPFPGTVLPATGSIGGNVDFETIDANPNHFNGLFVMESVGAGALFGVGVQKVALGHASGEAQFTVAPSPIGIGAAFLVGGAEVDGPATLLPATQPSP